MKSINLSDLRSAVAGANLAGHVVVGGAAVRQDVAKVGKQVPEPSRD